MNGKVGKDHTFPKIALRDLLSSIVENIERSPMASDSEDIEDGVKNPFGKVMIGDIPLETKKEDKDLPTSQMVIDVNTLKNELLEDEARSCI